MLYFFMYNFAWVKKMKILNSKFGMILYIGALIFFVLAILSAVFMIKYDYSTVEYIFGTKLLDFAAKELAITFIAAFLTFSYENGKLEK